MIIGEYSDVGVAKNSASAEGFAWGLASLGLGGVVLLAAPITLVFNVLLWRAGPAGVPKELAILGGAFGLLTMLGLACCGIVFGVTGYRIDRDDRRSSPLATAGVLVGAAATIVWMIVGMDLFLILS